MKKSNYASKRKLSGRSVILRTSATDYRELTHLANRYTNGNKSECIRVLIREEMKREIARGKA